MCARTSSSRRGFSIHQECYPVEQRETPQRHSAPRGSGKRGAGLVAGSGSLRDLLYRLLVELHLLGDAFVRPASHAAQILDDQARVDRVADELLVLVERRDLGSRAMDLHVARDPDAVWV